MSNTLCLTDADRGFLRTWELEMKVFFKFTRAKGQESSNSDGRAGEREGTRDHITGTAGATVPQGESAALNKGQATLVGAGAGSRGLIQD